MQPSSVLVPGGRYIRIHFEGDKVRESPAFCAVRPVYSTLCFDFGGNSSFGFLTACIYIWFLAAIMN